jgi:hypothetical protein
MFSQLMARGYHWGWSPRTVPVTGTTTRYSPSSLEVLADGRLKIAALGSVFVSGYLYVSGQG